MDNKKLALMHPDTKEVLAEIYEDRVIYYNEFLETNMRRNGISIPASMRQVYQDRTVIYPKEAGFSKAFIEIYYQFCLRESGFVLE